MAKRFIDTEIFADDWFSELTSDAKVAWIYLMTNCDHAGIFKVNDRLFQFQTGIKGFDTVMKEFTKRLVTLRPGYFFIPGFIAFQYGNDLNTNVPLHKSVVKRLQEFELIIDGKIKGLSDTCISAKDKSKSKDKNKSKKLKYEGVGEKNFTQPVISQEEPVNPEIPTLDEFLTYCKEQFRERYEPFKESLELKYKAWVEGGWRDGNDQEIGHKWKRKIISVMQYLIQNSKDGTNKNFTNKPRATRGVNNTSGTWD